jgi:hypothetical protein
MTDMIAESFGSDRDSRRFILDWVSNIGRSAISDKLARCCAGYRCDVLITHALAFHMGAM